MKSTFFVLLALGVLMTAADAQTVYQLPFASSGNTIELAVENTSSIPASVTVEATDIPGWLHFTTISIRLDAVSPGKQSSSTFTFAVDKTAPVGHQHTIRFVALASSGQSWTKDITLSVDPPERFELSQNYPNPFNPSTAIPFQLPKGARVRITVFNLLGQEVAHLADGLYEPGYHEVTWNAAGCASGMYVYQLEARDGEEHTTVSRKTLVLLK